METDLVKDKGKVAYLPDKWLTYPTYMTAMDQYDYIVISSMTSINSKPLSMLNDLGIDSGLLKSDVQRYQGKGAAHPNDGTQCRSVSTDEPIGVDPATRDYILRTIITTTT